MSNLLSITYHENKARISYKCNFKTNGEVTNAIRDYSHRFGGIEPLFKNQKSNGFYLESVSNAILESFVLYTCLPFYLTQVLYYLTSPIIQENTSESHSVLNYMISAKIKI